MASRVVPAISLTMVRGSPTMALKSDDLPALGRPTMATGISAGGSSAALAAPPASPASSRMMRSSRSPVPSPCTAETSWARRARARRAPATRRRRRVVELVGDEEHRHLGAAQDVGDLEVVGQRTRAAVDDEEHEVGRADGQLDLVADVPGEGRLRVGVVAAGVDHPQRPSSPLHLDLLAVARDPRRLVDDGGARSAEAVHEGGLAGVGRADDDDGGQVRSSDSLANASPSDAARTRRPSQAAASSSSPTSSRVRPSRPGGRHAARAATRRRPAAARAARRAPLGPRAGR